MSVQVSRLMKLGLSEREAKLYFALLQHPDMTGSDLQVLVDIPKTKIQETLVRMVERKLCHVRQSGNVKHYSPVEPNQILSLRKQDMARQLVEIDNLNATLTEIFENRKGQPPEVEHVEVLRSRSQMIERRAALLKDCHDELLIFRKRTFEMMTLKESDRSTMEAVKRIKRVRVIYEYDAWGTQTRREYITKWCRAGEDTRFVRTLPTKLLIFDGRHALTLVRDSSDSNTEISLLLASYELAQTFRSLFEYIWENATTFEEFEASYGRIVHSDKH